MTRLLLVEDDFSLGQTLQERLQKEGYQVDWATSFAKANEFHQNHRYDLMILDVGLPDGSGFDFAKSVRKQTAIPFVFVTAETSAEQRLFGYEIGAEEYIPKPFHLKELLLRVRHVLENHAARPVMNFGPVEIDFERRQVSHRGQVQPLKDKELNVLKLLIERSPAVVSRDEMLNKIWGEDQFPTQRTVDNIILRLRQLLGEETGQFIKTIRGVGYQWESSGGSFGQS